MAFAAHDGACCRVCTYHSLHSPRLRPARVMVLSHTLRYMYVLGCVRCVRSFQLFATFLCQLRSHGYPPSVLVEL